MVLNVILFSWKSRREEEEEREAEALEAAISQRLIDEGINK
jgi:hypothetical protein